jgi:PAS domain S-box-containing protein
MDEKNIISPDERIGKILDLLVKYAVGDFSARENVSIKGDELDAVIIGINTLGEEVNSSGKTIKDYEKRVGSLMNTLLKYTLFDFSEKAEVSGIGDELDAIAIGLTTMAEELESARESEKTQMLALKESEENFRLLIEGVKDYSMFLLDPSGCILTWNKGAENVKGYKTEEIIGKHFSIFYTEEEIVNREPERNLKMAAQNGSYEDEGWRARKDGSLFWADVIFTALYHSDGTLKGYSKITRDITERKKAEENIKSTNYFLDAILENIPNMVFVKETSELRFVRLNKAGEKLLGYSRDQLIGKNDYDFFPAEQADFFTSKDREAVKKDDITDIPEELIDTANGQRWLHTRKIPINDESGNTAYLLGISEDITDNKSNEEKIKSLNKELHHNNVLLKNINTELEAFTYSVSHDLRAPLRAIHGYTKILEQEHINVLDEDARSMMTAVMNNAKKMGQLIDDLLSLSHLGKKELQKRAVDMADLANQTLSEIKKVFNNYKAQVIIHPMPKAEADYNLIYQVFINLISNAVKYSSLKEKPLIEIGSKEENDEVIYFVKDNGSGFDMKYYGKLFGIFQRLHDASEFEGTGVGLALVKRIILRHEGKIWAESQPDIGTVFYFTLRKSI